MLVCCSSQQKHSDFRNTRVWEVEKVQPCIRSCENRLYFFCLSQFGVFWVKISSTKGNTLEQYCWAVEYILQPMFALVHDIVFKLCFVTFPYALRAVLVLRLHSSQKSKQGWPNCQFHSLWALPTRTAAVMPAPQKQWAKQTAPFSYFSNINNCQDITAETSIWPFRLVTARSCCSSACNCVISHLFNGTQITHQSKSRTNNKAGNTREEASHFFLNQATGGRLKVVL